MTAITPSRSETDELARTWYKGVDLGEVTKYQGFFLFDLLSVETHLFLREHLYRKRQWTQKQALNRRVKSLLIRYWPAVLFMLERQRGKNGVSSPSRLNFDEPSILFVVQAATETDSGTLLPVVRRIKEDGKYRPIIMTGNGKVCVRLAKEPFSVIDMGTHPPNVRLYASIVSKLYAALTAAAGRNANRLKVLATLGFIDFFCSRILSVLHSIDACCAIVQPGIKAVVVASDTHATGKMAVQRANSLGIPTFVLQDGLYQEHSAFGFFPVTATHACVWGEASKQTLQRLGLTSERISVTGPTRFESIHLDMDSAKTDVHAALQIPSNSRLFTFASQPIFHTLKDHHQVVQAFSRTLQEIPDTVLIIKLHPAEIPAFWEESISREGVKNIRIIKQTNLHKLLAASDLVFTIFSTVGLEALLLDKPLIVLKHTDRSDETRFIESGAARGAKLNELSVVVKSCLFDEESRIRLKEGRQCFVDNYVYKRGTGATQRVLDVIYRAIECGAENC